MHGKRKKRQASGGQDRRDLGPASAYRCTVTVVCHRNSHGGAPFAGLALRQTRLGLITPKDAPPNQFPENLGLHLTGTLVQLGA